MVFPLMPYTRLVRMKLVVRYEVLFGLGEHAWGCYNDLGDEGMTTE